MKKIQIIIADDHALVRNGLKGLIQQVSDMEVIADVENALMLEEMVLEKGIIPDVLLMDITMPGKNGIDTMQEIKKINPNIKCIVLTMHEEPTYVIKAVKSGADGYMLKNVEFNELKNAIYSVVAGKKVFNENITKIIAENLHAAEENENTQLTSREEEILREIAKGLTMKEIAEKLFISSRTVETHRTNIMRKMGVHNTAELIKKAIELKLI
ncbi:MAG: response regulator transcription factor [Cytophagaceae bacterium]|nr:response regulator transcription factor [Cytophagaceae bacterium]MDW8456242.1 response regulator transcription factor [Cytophagaceae bacterium]